MTAFDTPVDTRPAQRPPLELTRSGAHQSANEETVRAVRLLWAGLRPSSPAEPDPELVGWAARHDDHERAIGRLVLVAGAQLDRPARPRWSPRPRSEPPHVEPRPRAVPSGRSPATAVTPPGRVSGSLVSLDAVHNLRGPRVDVWSAPAVAAGPAPVAAPAPVVAVAPVPTITDGPAPDLGPMVHRAPGLQLKLSSVGQSVIGPAVAVRPVVEPEGITQRAARQARAFLWMELAGVLVILFVAYQLWGTGFEQRRAQAHLRHAYFASASGSRGSGDTATVGGGSLPSSGPSVARLPGGAVARIQIPAIHVDQFVVEGTSESDLKRGPGHYPGSPFPGQPGNSAIAGHRTTYGAPFSRLDELKPGDTIITSTATRRYLYVVARQLVVSPGETSVVDDYGDSRLTLTTCTPKFLATQRLVVVASLSGPAPANEPARTAAPPLPSTRSVAPAGPAAARLREANRGFSLGALPLSVLVIALIVGLGLLYRPARRRLPPVAAAAVLAPFWVAVVLVLFEQLTKFLPPNV